jgi:deazaflavin-dependent oxidoreductase (nitroreductase family)
VSAVLLLVAAADAAPDIDPALRDASTLELTTTGRKSGRPRTVTIWFVYEDRLYVQSGQEGKTDWYQNALAKPAVTVKIGEREWRGQVRPIDDAAETARVHELFRQKYLSARVMSWFGGGFGVGKVVRIDLE